MNYKVEFTDEADNDVFEAKQWYESRQLGLGNELLDEIEVFVKILEHEPKIYQIRKHNWRYCPLKRFPYLLFYEIKKREVIVYAVFNTLQNPVNIGIRQII